MQNIDLYLFCFSTATGSSLCPLLPLALTQVEIIRSFTAKQPDELSLQVADVVLIYQCVSDGEWECSDGGAGGPVFRVSFCHHCLYSLSLWFPHMRLPLLYLHFIASKCFFNRIRSHGCSLRK